MPNANVYLHEIITIVGAGSEPYKAHTGLDWEARWRERKPILVGTWQLSGSTGDWPRVVNLWEMQGWDHWADTLDAQYRGVGQPRTLKKWWNKALEYRSGGFDRILEAADYSPTARDLAVQGVKGAACLQEIATVRSGAADAYLEAVSRHWLRPAATHGLTLTGAFRTTMRDTEVVLMWSLPTLRHFTDYLKTVRTARDTRRWHERAREWRTDYRETLLVPSQWCITHPAWKAPRGLLGVPRSARRAAR